MKRLGSNFQIALGTWAIAGISLWSVSSSNKTAEDTLVRVDKTLQALVETREDHYRPQVAFSSSTQIAYIDGKNQPIGFPGDEKKKSASLLRATNYGDGPAMDVRVSWTIWSLAKKTGPSYYDTEDIPLERSIVDSWGFRPANIQPGGSGAIYRAPAPFNNADDSRGADVAEGELRIECYDLRGQKYFTTQRFTLRINDDGNTRHMWFGVKPVNRNHISEGASGAPGPSDEPAKPMFVDWGIVDDNNFVNPSN